MKDLISRADAVKTVIRKCSPICAWKVGTQKYPDCVVAEINALPSADAVQGEWIDENGNNVPLHKDGYPLRSCYCNQCHEWLVASDEYEVKGNFCPNCGARLKGGDDE